MKPKIKLLIFSLLLTLTSSHASSLLFAPSLPFKEGVITYSISGNRHGHAVAYIKNYGNEIALYSDYQERIMSAKQHHNRLTLITGSDMYQVDLDTKVATHQQSLTTNLRDQFKDLRAEMQEKIIKKSADMSHQLVCQNLTIDATQYCLNGNIIISKESRFFGFHERWKILKIEERKVDSKYFQLPALNETKEIFVNENNAPKIIEEMIESPSQNSSVY